VIMAKIIQTFEGPSCATAWLEGVQFVRDAKRAYNVSLGVETPAELRPVDVAIQDCVDAFLRAHDSDPLSTVASSIFPAGQYLHGGATEVFNEIPDLLSKMKGRWDGYAGRMLAKTLTLDNEPISPLERLLLKMKRQAKSGSIYDISIDDPHDPLLDLTIYEAEKDAGSIYPPCLMHLSFKLVKKRVYLTATYRSHYYVQKVLGNLLGLAQLQFFIATELGNGFSVGPLVCHSTDATFDRGGGKKPKWSNDESKALIDECLAIVADYDSSTAQATA
jgi:hypothetical protein